MAPLSALRPFSRRSRNSEYGYICGPRISMVLNVGGVVLADSNGIFMDLRL